MVTDYVYAWTPEQLQFAVELVTSCFDTLAGLVEGARREECCGPFYNTSACLLLVSPKSPTACKHMGGGKGCLPCAVQTCGHGAST